MSNITVYGTFELVIELKNPPEDLFTRTSPVEHFPYWNHNGTPLTKEQVIQHWAWNALRGVRWASDLDGWGDADSSVYFHLKEANVEEVVES